MDEWKPYLPDAYLRFDVRGIGDAPILNPKLRLYQRYAPGGGALSGIKIHGLDRGDHV